MSSTSVRRVKAPQFGLPSEFTASLNTGVLKVRSVPPAARISDNHVCPMVTGLVPHVGGPIIVGSANVITCGLPQARVSDVLVCIGPPDVIARGSSGVFVNGLPAARLGDSTAHGGVIVVGAPTVIIGETMSGSPSGEGGAPDKGAVDLAFAEFNAQVQVLKDAARDGTPFCEVCFAKAVKQLDANLAAASD